MEEGAASCPCVVREDVRSGHADRGQDGDDRRPRDVGGAGRREDLRWIEPSASSRTVIRAGRRDGRAGGAASPPGRRRRARGSSRCRSSGAGCRLEASELAARADDHLLHPDRVSRCPVVQGSPASSASGTARRYAALPGGPRAARARDVVGGGRRRLAPVRRPVSGTDTRRVATSDSTRRAEASPRRRSWRAAGTGLGSVDPPLVERSERNRHSSVLTEIGTWYRTQPAQDAPSPRSPVPRQGLEASCRRRSSRGARRAAGSR